MKVIARGVAESLVVDGHILITVKSVEKDAVVLSIESTEGEFPYREETVTLDRLAHLVPQSSSR